MSVCGESSLCCTEVTIILKNVYLATFTASQQHARISTEFLYLPMKQAWDVFSPKLDICKRILDQVLLALHIARLIERQGFTLLSDLKATEFMNLIHNWEAGA